jgi:hypothetical protein
MNSVRHVVDDVFPDALRVRDQEIEARSLALGREHEELVLVANLDNAVVTSFLAIGEQCHLRCDPAKR